MQAGATLPMMSDMVQRTTADALVVIDLQVDYVEAPGLRDRRTDLVSGVAQLARRAHEAGVPVVEVRTVHAADRSTWTLDMLEDGEGLVIAGTPGADRLPELDLAPDTVVVKTRDSAFFGTDLLDALGRARRPALVGVSTESCVRATAVDAYAHDLRAVLVADAMASADESQHRETLDRLHTQYRLPVARLADVEFVAPPPPEA